MNDYYAEIAKLRLLKINDYSYSNGSLNHFHDLIYQQVITASLKNLSDRRGVPPTSFMFFVMGSAGRREQSIWSDQDHGLVFLDDSMEAQEYFLELGIEISIGLEQAGYKRCNGSVMASNPLWCKSLPRWQQQLDSWISESSWESIRHLLIFADGRSLYGDSSMISALKEKSFAAAKKGNLLYRMLQNTMHIKKGVGLLGQLLVETHGTFSGSINLKETAFLPFVNAARLLSLIEGTEDTSTISRITYQSGLGLSTEEKDFYSKKFSTLLDFRLEHSCHHNYDAGHYVDGSQLTKKEKQVLKEILKSGELFYESTQKIIKRM